MSLYKTNASIRLTRSTIFLSCGLKQGENALTMPKLDLCKPALRRIFCGTWLTSGGILSTNLTSQQSTHWRENSQTFHQKEDLLPSVIKRDKHTQRTMMLTDAHTTSAVEPVQQFMVVGLGNHISPSTRHSVGMHAVDRLAERLGAEWTKAVKATGGTTSETQLEEMRGVKLVLLKPKDFMNVNGKSVAKTARLWSIQPECVYLIHDELDLKPGALQLKEGGSARGHRGVLSCIDCLKSQAMPRLRIGIGRPSSKLLVIPYVLDKFHSSEMDTINSAIDQGLDKMLLHITRRAIAMREGHGGNSTTGSTTKRDQSKKRSSFWNKVEEKNAISNNGLSEESDISLSGNGESSEGRTNDEHAGNNERNVDDKSLTFQNTIASSGTQRALDNSSSNSSEIICDRSDIEKKKSSSPTQRKRKDNDSFLDR